KHITVMPALIGRPVVEAGINTLIVEHRTGQNLAYITPGTKQQYASTGWQCLATLFNLEIPVQQKGDRVSDLHMLGVAPSKLFLVPTHGGFIKALVDRDIGQNHAIVSVLRGITQEALQLALGNLFIPRCTANVALSGVALEIDRFF